MSKTSQEETSLSKREVTDPRSKEADGGSNNNNNSKVTLIICTLYFNCNRKEERKIEL